MKIYIVHTWHQELIKQPTIGLMHIVHAYNPIIHESYDFKFTSDNFALQTQDVVLTTASIVTSACTTNSTRYS